MERDGSVLGKIDNLTFLMLGSLHVNLWCSRLSFPHLQRMIFPKKFEPEVTYEDTSCLRICRVNYRDNFMSHASVSRKALLCTYN